MRYSLFIIVTTVSSSSCGILQCLLLGGEYHHGGRMIKKGVITRLSEKFIHIEIRIICSIFYILSLQNISISAPEGSSANVGE